jgi:hypothetical protein
MQPGALIHKVLKTNGMTPAEVIKGLAIREAMKA